MSRLFLAESHGRVTGLAVWRRAPRRRSRRGSRNLFDRWAEVRLRLAVAPHVALFVDFDGTLAPVHRHPHKVRLEPGVRQLLARLARRPRFTVCIISGRRLADIRRRAAVRGVKYMGLHGWERDGAGGAKADPETMRRAKRRIHSLGYPPGVWVENKGIGCAVHYRGATETAVRRARAALRDALKPFAGTVRLLRGKKVWEILPGDFAGKGEAAREFLTELQRSALPIFLGDDTTDESAFALLRHGITVRVGPARRTLARFRLRDSGEVRRFLELLAEEIP